MRPNVEIEGPPPATPDDPNHTPIKVLSNDC